MFRTLFAAAAVSAAVFATTAAVAQQDVVTSRQDLMKRSGQQLAVVNGMVRGQEQFDTAKVGAAFNAFADKAQKLPGLFPPDSREGTRAQSKIWDDPGAWKAEIDTFAKHIADGRPKAVANLEGLKAALPPIVAECSSCHETFRAPRR